MDGDTVFDKQSIDQMRTLMVQDSRIGAVSGRIYPKSPHAASNPIVWYQMFEVIHCVAVLMRSYQYENMLSMIVVDLLSC